MSEAYGGSVIVAATSLNPEATSNVRNDYPGAQHIVLWPGHIIDVENEIEDFQDTIRSSVEYLADHIRGSNVYLLVAGYCWGTIVARDALIACGIPHEVILYDSVNRKHIVHEDFVGTCGGLSNASA